MQIVSSLVEAAKMGMGYNWRTDKCSTEKVEDQQVGSSPFPKLFFVNVTAAMAVTSLDCSHRCHGRLETFDVNVRGVFGLW